MASNPIALRSRNTLDSGKWLTYDESLDLVNECDRLQAALDKAALSVDERTRRRGDVLTAAGAGKDEFPPYSEDERRVCDYLLSLADIGCGADPIGFLVASHSALRQRIADLEAKAPAPERVREMVDALREFADAEFKRSGRKETFESDLADKAAQALTTLAREVEEADATIRILSVTARARTEHHAARTAEEGKGDGNG